ncbi:MAG: hypothetical protein ACK5LK_04970 [Chthoniobacterales bacterium]
MLPITLHPRDPGRIQKGFLESHYGSVHDGITVLGEAGQIGEMFSGFQKHLFAETGTNG